MENFLEIILSVEREAASLEKEAKERLLEIERSYREELTRLEEDALKETKEVLQSKRDSELTQAKREIQSIEERLSKEEELLEQAGKRVRQDAAKMVAAVILPSNGGHRSRIGERTEYRLVDKVCCLRAYEE